MYPTLRDGERVVVDTTACREAPPAVGDVVLARHPFMRDMWMIKRVVGVADDGRYLLRGDNALESSDSRSFGPVAPRSILGRALPLVMYEPILLVETNGFLFISPKERYCGS